MSDDATSDLTEPRKRAVVYVRVSNMSSAETKISIDTQVASCLRYCGFRGLEVVETILEPGAVSGGKPIEKRKGGARLLEMIKAREIDAVVAVKLDRLFRSTTDCIDTTRAWDAAGITLHLVDMGGQSVDASSTLGRFLLTMFAAVGEMERGLTGERTRAVMAHKRNRGEATSHAPYGFRIRRENDGKPGARSYLDPCPEEQALHMLMHKLASDEVSIRGIVKHLEKTGAQCRGGAWHATTVARLLKRPPGEVPKETREMTMTKKKASA